MATKFEIEKIKYLHSLSETKGQYVKFKNENVTQTSTMNFNVYTAEPLEFYISVSDVIHSACVILETGVDKKSISGKNRSFISAIRYIDNLIKHGEKEIKIEELISSTPKIMGKGSNKNGILTFKPQIELESFWKEIPPWIEVKEQNRNQKANYEMYIQGKKVIDTIESLDKVVKKYIVFD